MKEIMNVISHKNLFDLTCIEEKLSYYIQIYQLLKIKTDIDDCKFVQQYCNSVVTNSPYISNAIVYKEYTILGMRFRVKQKNDRYKQLRGLRNHIDSLLVYNEN